MNREIEFRVWSKEGQDMINFEELLEAGDFVDFFKNQNEDGYYSKLMRYYGHKDKNGKKIFEEDIIKLVNENGETIRVICKFGTARRRIFENTVDITGFYFETLDGRKTFQIVNNYCGKHDLELFEVIGDTYRNPEILEG